MHVYKHVSYLRTYNTMTILAKNPSMNLENFGLNSNNIYFTCAHFSLITKLPRNLDSRESLTCTVTRHMLNIQARNMDGP